MDILTYLLALSLTVISVVKTTELFHLSDKKLGEIKSDFIKQTRDMHSNQKGSITFVAVLFVLIVSALLYFYVGKMQIEYKEAVYRKDSYLCFRFLNKKTESYINEMAKFNIALRAAFLAKSTVVDAGAGEVAFRALIYTRNARHFYYLKELVSNNYCEKSDSLNYLTQLPFQTNTSGTLETNIDETTLVRSNQWTSTIYKVPRGIRLKKSFCLKTEFQIKGAFFPNLKMSSEEVPVEDTSSLKCLSGSQSSS